MKNLIGGHTNISQRVGIPDEAWESIEALGIEGRLVRINSSWEFWVESSGAQEEMKDHIENLLERGFIPIISCFGFPQSFTDCTGTAEDCRGAPPLTASTFIPEVRAIIQDVVLPAYDFDGNGNSYDDYFVNGEPVPHLYGLLNEPDLLQFFTGTRAEYEQTLDWLTAAILAEDPDAQFVGPATSGFGGTLANDPTAPPVQEIFLEWFDTQVSNPSSSLETSDLYYLDLHNYNPDPEEFRGTDETYDVLNRLDGPPPFLDNDFGSTQTLYSEWNTTLGSIGLNSIRAGAFAARKYAMMADWEQNRLDAHTFFKFIDTFEQHPNQIPTVFPSTPDPGAVNQHGLHKSFYHAHWMMSQMMPNSVETTLLHGDWSERNLLASWDDGTSSANFGTTTLLLASGGNDPTNGDPNPLPATVEIRVNPLPAGLYLYRTYEMRDTPGAAHGDAASRALEIQDDYQLVWNWHMEYVIEADLLGLGWHSTIVDAVVNGGTIQTLVVPGLITDPEETLAILAGGGANTLVDNITAALDANENDRRLDLVKLIHEGLDYIPTTSPGSSQNGGWNQAQGVALKNNEPGIILQHTGGVLHLPTISLASEGAVLVILEPQPPL